MPHHQKPFSTQSMPRDIVLDTNVLVAAFRSTQGASYQLVRSIGLADWRLNVSVALALEYEDVLKREGMLPGISRQQIDDFLDYIFRTSRLVRFVVHRRPSLQDPDDERILEVAVQCRAMIVTHNQKDFVGVEQFGVAVKRLANF
jgi:putative PIN family toxin of toxin-antitoxin system